MPRSTFARPTVSVIVRRMLAALVTLTLAVACLVAVPLTASATGCDLSGTVSVHGAVPISESSISIRYAFDGDPSQFQYVVDAAYDGSYCIPEIRGIFHIEFQDSNGVYGSVALYSVSRVTKILDVDMYPLGTVAVSGTVSLEGPASSTLRAVVTSISTGIDLSAPVDDAGHWSVNGVPPDSDQTVCIVDSDGIYGRACWQGTTSGVFHVGTDSFGQISLAMVGFRVSGTIAGDVNPAGTSVTAYEQVDSHNWVQVQRLDGVVGAWHMGLPLGHTYRIRFTSAGRIDQTFPLINSFSEVGSAGTTLSDIADTSSDVSAVMVAAHSISGHLTFSAGHGHKASVFLEQATPENAESSVLIDEATGYWHFDNLEPGEYRVRFSSDVPRWINEWYGNSPDAAGATVITMAAEDIASIDADLAQVDPIGIRGTASVPVGVEPPTTYSFALSKLDSTVTPNTWNQVATTASTSGAYELGADVSEGEYRVAVRAVGFVTFVSEPFTVYYEQVPEISPVLSAATPHSISGTVTGPSDRSTLAVKAYVHPGEDPTKWLLVATSAVASDGSYRLPVFDGAFYLEFTDNSGLYQNEAYDDQVLSHGATIESAVNPAPVDVTGSDQAGISVTLTPTPGITGIVIDSSGAPVAGVTVKAYRWNDDEQTWLDNGPEVVTTASGRYIYDGVSDPQLFSLHFGVKNLATTSISSYLNGLPTQPTPDATASLVNWTSGQTTRNFTLADGPPVTGRVLAGTVPVTAAAIQLYRWNSGWTPVRATTTLANGTFGVIADVHGKYTASATTAAGTLFLGGGSTLPSGLDAGTWFEYSDSVNSIGDFVFAAAKVDDPPKTGDDAGDPDPLTFTVGSVAITGTAKVGKTLKVKFAKWTPKPIYSYSWLANGKAIKKATKSSYRIAASVKGKKISVKVTAKKAGYVTVVRTSKATGKVKAL